MRVLYDRTESVTRDYDKERKLDDITTILVHRIGVGESANVIAEWFRQHGPDWIGTRSMPYHFIIQRLGTTEQALPLTTKAPHAAKWNRAAIGIGVIGDFRFNEPTLTQIASLTVLCARLQDRLGRKLRILGHTAVKGGSHDPGKVCPGKFFPLSDIQTASHSMGAIQC